MAKKKLKRVIDTRLPTRADQTTVDLPEEEEEEIASTVSQVEGGPSAVSVTPKGAFGRTVWDFLTETGAQRPVSKLLAEVDPIEILGTVTYLFIAWLRPESLISILSFLGLLALYHLVLKPFYRIIIVLIAPKVAPFGPQEPTHRL